MAKHTNEQRVALDKEAGRLVVDVLLKAGYLVAIDNGAEDKPWSTRPTKNAKRLHAGLFLTDEDRVYAVDPETKRAVGWVYLVYGNDGYDAVSDYTVNLEKTVGRAASAFFDRHCFGNCDHDGKPVGDCGGRDCKRHGRCCWQ